MLLCGRSNKKGISTELNTPRRNHATQSTNRLTCPIISQTEQGLCKCPVESGLRRHSVQICRHMQNTDTSLFVLTSSSLMALCLMPVHRSLELPGARQSFLRHCLLETSAILSGAHQYTFITIPTYSVVMESHVTLSNRRDLGLPASLT